MSKYRKRALSKKKALFIQKPEVTILYNYIKMVHHMTLRFTQRLVVNNKSCTFFLQHCYYSNNLTVENYLVVNQAHALFHHIGHKFVGKLQQIYPVRKTKKSCTFSQLNYSTFARQASTRSKINLFSVYQQNDPGTRSHKKQQQMSSLFAKKFQVYPQEVPNWDFPVVRNG